MAARYRRGVVDVDQADGPSPRVEGLEGKEGVHRRQADDAQPSPANGGRWMPMWCESEGTLHSSRAVYCSTSEPSALSLLRGACWRLQSRCARRRDAAFPYLVATTSESEVPCWPGAAASGSGMETRVVRVSRAKFLVIYPHGRWEALVAVTAVIDPARLGTSLVQHRSGRATPWASRFPLLHTPCICIHVVFLF